MKKDTPKAKEAKTAVKSVLFITGKETKVMGFTNATARKMKQQVLAAAHSLGHTHIQEHDVRFGIEKDWPVDNSDILRLVSHNGTIMPASAPSPMQQQM